MQDVPIFATRAVAEVDYRLFAECPRLLMEMPAGGTRGLHDLASAPRPGIVRYPVVVRSGWLFLI
jgi:hypothetical protein